MVQPKTNLCSGARLMSPNDTFQKLQRIHLSFKTIINKAKDTTNTLNNVDSDLPDMSDPLMCSNGKRQRTFTKADIEKDLFNGVAQRKLQDTMHRLGIGGVYVNNMGRTVWSVSQEQRNQIAQQVCKTFLPKKRLECEKMQILLVNSLKGGGGKTSLALALAGALATGLNQSLRIGVIDLDPQGSTTDVMLPYLDVLHPDSLSVGDLLMHQFEPLEFDEGETFEQCVRDTFLKANIPNLSILPARETDTAFDYASKYHAQAGYHAADSLEPILAAVQDDFDIILIDTPPVLNEAAFGAHYLATSSIIPLRASQNDRDSTAKYARQLPELYRKMHERGHQGYDAIMLATTNVTETSRSETQLVSDLTSLLGADMLPSFKTSEAVRACADSFKTIFELNPSEYGKIDSSTNKTALGSRAQLANAQANVMSIALEVEKVINSVWDNQRKLAGQQNETDLMLEEL